MFPERWAEDLRRRIFNSSFLLPLLMQRWSEGRLHRPLVDQRQQQNEGC
jgi:hypothetical protein